MRKMTRVERKMRRRRNFFRFLLLLFLTSSLIVLALKTDLFIIDNINIIGNNKITRETIIEASSIRIGENIFKVATKSAEENIGKLPYIKEVTIRRKFPRTINMEIRERKEVAQIKDISSFILIDDEGRILDLKDSKSEELPIIIGWEIHNKSYGGNVFAEVDLEAKVEFIRESLNIGLLEEIVNVDMKDKDNINLKVVQDINVQFGDLDNLQYKLRLLHEVVKYVKDEEICCTMILMNKGGNPIIVTDEGVEDEAY